MFSSTKYLEPTLTKNINNDTRFEKNKHTDKRTGFIFL